MTGFQVRLMEGLTRRRGAESGCALVNPSHVPHQPSGRRVGASQAVPSAWWRRQTEGLGGLGFGMGVGTVAPFGLVSSVSDGTVHF
ncbi:hypothetical protein C0R05_31875 [Streptomyces albidoflavus]|nr:hypothetical protein C0R05_31875 [Streptomyces albidoflavus]